ncbi:ribonuclease H2 subunit B [Leptinotarsa decemlineata]|uniref:ribonuclease H2 subunit B n=1 Tax=Leptinotarsa decemlineata TaxID=7539 RepID=UPI003D3091AB
MGRLQTAPENCPKRNLQEPTNSWVFLLKEDTLDFDNCETGTPTIVTLRHPKTDDSAKFLVSPRNNTLQEIFTFTDGPRSWFIDESVKSNGTLHLSTPIDPIFLVLPYLRKHCTTRAIPLRQLLIDDEYPETERLLGSSGLEYLNLVSDRKGDEELLAYKYNEEKTLSWLKKKTSRVAEVIKQKNINVLKGAATSETFIESSECDIGDYLRFAHEIISEYLVDDLSEKLLRYLDLSPENNENKQGSKRKSEMIFTNPKKNKVEEGDSCLSELKASRDEIKVTKKPIQSAKDKARTKAALGSKTIGSFFKKK